jgi:hypothetical protein
MNSRKIFLFIASFLCFLLSAFLVAKIQSQMADQVFQAHGLSNNSRIIKCKNQQQTIAHLLNKLQNKPKQPYLQLHFQNRADPNEILVWANREIPAMPLTNGHYFSLDDFKGEVTLAVTGSGVNKDIITRQGNQYIFWHQRYLSVIANLKSKEKRYYLSTGPKQITAQAKLADFKLTADSNNAANIKSLAHYLKAATAMPKFVKQHKQSQLTTILPLIVVIVLLALLNLIAISFVATLTAAQARLSALHGKLLHNWLINRSIRNLLVVLLLAIIAYVLTAWQAYLSNQGILLLVLGISVFLDIVGYCSILYQQQRRGHNNAA